MRIKTPKYFPWEEREHGRSHNLTCVILSEEQGNNKICANYRLWSKYNNSIDHIKNNYDMKENVKIKMWLNLYTEKEVNN